MKAEAPHGTYVAVVNHEEQYSVWAADRELPPGWTEAGKRGTKDECLEPIRRAWTDMRPKSLRDRMDRDGTSPSTAAPVDSTGSVAP